MTNPTTLEQLLEAVYAAPLDPREWQSVAPLLADFVGCRSAFIHVRNVRGAEVLGVTENADMQAHVDYESHYGAIDPWALGWRRQPKLRDVLTGSEVVDVASLARSEFYNDFSRRLGAFHWMGSVVGAGPNDVLVFSAHRPVEAEAFGTEEIRRLHRLLPHLERAGVLQRTLAAAELQRRASVDALERLAFGVALVDADARLGFANLAAETLLRADDGLTLRQGRLRAIDPGQDVELREAVRRASAIAHGKPGPLSDAIRLTRAGKPPLSALISPLQAERRLLALGGASVMVFVTDPQARPLPRVSVLATLYRLTSAEARLLASLLQGERPGDYAERCSVSINTVRTQLKQLFAKTGTSGQADLMRLAFTDLVAGLRREPSD